MRLFIVPKQYTYVFSQRYIKRSYGITWIDAYIKENKVKERPYFTEYLTGTYQLSYALPTMRGAVDISGNVISPMRLPLLSDKDPRDPNSPWMHILNAQYTHRWGVFEVFGGVKNILDFTPPANSIARAHDPFDTQVEFDSEGAPKPTLENPYALTFDPSYVFASNQGRRLFLGMRWNLK